MLGKDLLEGSRGLLEGTRLNTLRKTTYMLRHISRYSQETGIVYIISYGFIATTLSAGILIRACYKYERK